MGLSVDVTNKNYKVYLVYLKAIASVFVVLGHCFAYLENYSDIFPAWGSWLSVIITSTHVPLFFVVAGYLCLPKPMHVYLKQKITRIIVPYFTFAILKLVFTFFISSSFEHGTGILSDLYDTFILGRGYWFVYCLFLSYLLAPLFWKKESTTLLQFNIRIFSVVLILVIFNFINIDLNMDVFPQSVTIGAFVATTPLFQVQRLCMYFPYFCVGLFLRQNEKLFTKIIVERKKFLIPLCLIVALVVSYVIAFTELKKGYIPKMCVAYSMMILLYFLFKKISQNIPALKTIGKYSLQVMFFDSIYRVLLFAIFNKFIDLNIYYSFIIAALVIFLACASSYVISKIPYIRFAFGLGKSERKKE